jgi:hypothetical protein
MPENTATHEEILEFGYHLDAMKKPRDFYPFLFSIDEEVKSKSATTVIETDKD